MLTFECCRSADATHHGQFASNTDKRVVFDVHGVVEGRRISHWLEPVDAHTSQKYGGIFSLKLGPGTAIVLTDRQLVKQLIDKKSNIYSNRPHSYVSHDLISGGDHVLISHYGKTWQKYRKTIHQHFMESIVMKDHLPLQNAEAGQLLRDMLERPELFMMNARRFTNSIACATIWGVRSPDTETNHMNRLYTLMEDWSVVMEPGNTPPGKLFCAGFGVSVTDVSTSRHLPNPPLRS
jgi:cytochrome P450